MVQVFLLINGQWVPYGEPMTCSRGNLAAQLEGQGHQIGTFKIRRV